ncbi:MAG: hypothetical protein ABSG95_06375 [Solirubrobacteraceae bacterium]
MSLAAFSCGAAPAGAVVTNEGGQTYGIAPAEPKGTHTGIASPESALSYGAGPVVHSEANYLLFWAPQTPRTGEYPQGAYSGESERIIEEFFRNAASESGATTNVFAVATQYREGPTGLAPAYSSSFRGAYTDSDPFPTEGNCAGESISGGSICLTTSQIRHELADYIAANSLPSGLNPQGAEERTPIYFVFTPPGVDVCAGEAGAHAYCSEPKSASELSEKQICSYHSFIPAEAGHQTILYAVLPWSAGNYGTVDASPKISGSGCQDDTSSLQEPNQIGGGPDGEFNAGLADVIVNQAADEQIATVTDPQFDGWHDTTGDKDEVPDKCRNDFPLKVAAGLPGTEAEAGFNQEIFGGDYYINDEFDQAALSEHYPGVPCINRDNIVPGFTAQANVSNKRLITFNATESDIDLGVAKYHWSFGDETTAEVDCGARTPTNGSSPEECDSSSGTGNPNPVASVVHEYAYGGPHEVKLTVTDDGGNTGSYVASVDVSGPLPPPPAPPAEEKGSPSTSTQGGGGTSSSPSSLSSSAGTAKPPVAPRATQAVLSRSLSSVLHSGLLVRYSVDEQVAGRFEVLLATSVARRIGLHGPSATGFAQGTAPQTVIAKAILVTTKGGASTYKIEFSKTTAARLRRLGKVSLMLRLVLRNSSTGSTTILNAFTLSH